MLPRESNRLLPNRTGTFSCIRLSRHRIYLVSRSDPVSEVRQPEAVVFSSVDLTVALPADGHLFPVLESHQPGEPADGFASHLADVADVMHLHPNRLFADDAWVAQAGPRPESDVHVQWVRMLPPRQECCRVPGPVGVGFEEGVPVLPLAVLPSELQVAAVFAEELLDGLPQLVG